MKTVTYPKTKNYLQYPDGKKVINAKHLKTVKNLFFQTTITSDQIIKETEKAVFVNDTDYSNSFFDGDDTVFTEGFWMPKSQYFVKDNYICVAGFIAKEKHLYVVCK